VLVKVVELLLSKGSNKEHRNISDYTPLSQAASGGYVNVIKVLLAHGAEINSRFDNDISMDFFKSLCLFAFIGKVLPTFH